MEALFTSSTDAVPLVVDCKAVVGGLGGLALLSIAGVVPRIGLVRAFTLGWGSYFKKTFPLSIRKYEIQLVNDLFRSMRKKSCIAIIGGNGYGKSCLIDTALNRRHGVVKIRTEAGADKSHIIDEVLYEITGIECRINPTYSARRVLFFYSLMFKLPPIVVIRVPDRQAGQQYASLTSAVRELTDDYGLRVIVDGTLHSLPPELLSTSRKTLISVEEMSRKQIESIPEFQPLIEFLKAHKLDDAVWKVLGGSPVCYVRLQNTIDRLSMSNSTCTNDDTINEVKNHLKSRLIDALCGNIAKSSANTEAIIEVFRENNIIKMPIMDLVGKGFVLDYSNQVFHEVHSSDGHYYIEPVTAAVSLIISENIRDSAGVRELMARLLNIE